MGASCRDDVSRTRKLSLVISVFNSLPLSTIRVQATGIYIRETSQMGASCRDYVLRTNEITPLSFISFFFFLITSPYLKSEFGSTSCDWAFLKAVICEKAENNSMTDDRSIVCDGQIKNSVICEFAK